MYFVPDNTKKCGYYQCEKCGYKFLSLDTSEATTCPDCTAEIDYEIGPDETLETAANTAKLIDIVEDEDVEKMDCLLSLAITGGDYNWI
jgi:peptide subunit release factor 1 (eRF1)